MIFSVLISSGIQSNVLFVDSEQVIAKNEYVFIIYNYNIWVFHNKGNCIVKNNFNGLTMKIIFLCWPLVYVAGGKAQAMQGIPS